MKPRFSIRTNHALTLVEVLVLIVIVAVLVAILLPALAATRKKAQRISCISNLKEIGLSFRVWEGDHKNLYPMSISTNLGGTLEYVNGGQIFRHFQAMSNELSTPKILVCPSDMRQPANDFGSNFGNTNISYFLGVDADVSRLQMLLSGDRNIVGGTKVANNILEITTGQLVSWNSEIHDGVGNIGFADGSVWQADSESLVEKLQETGVATNRLAIP